MMDWTFLSLFDTSRDLWLTNSNQQVQNWLEFVWPEIEDGRFILAVFGTFLGGKNPLVLWKTVLFDRTALTSRRGNSLAALTKTTRDQSNSFKAIHEVFVEAVVTSKTGDQLKIVTHISPTIVWSKPSGHNAPN